MSTKRFSKQDEAQALERLREIVKPGDTIYTTLKHVSGSGMYRAIGVHAITHDKRYGCVPLWLSYNVAALGVGRWDDRREAVGVTGVGSDMGFEIVYSLGWRLFGNGWRCIGAGCPSNDHNNAPHPKPRRGTKHTDGGYALRHRWMS